MRRLENRARKVILGRPKACRRGKAVALCKDAFFNRGAFNDETTRIQENQEGAVTDGDHLQHNIARSGDFPGRLRYRPGKHPEARKDEGRERQVRRSEEERAASAKEGAASTEEA